MNNLKINRFLDHAVLKPEMSQKEVIAAIKLGIEYKVRTVCVRPCDIELALALCKGTETEVSCVLAFPHGDTLSESKTAEAKLYCGKGVKEIDMVVNYGYIKSGEWELVKKDIKAVTDITKAFNITSKVILETSTLTSEEIAKATETAVEAGADYVKTSTGFYGGGATYEAVETMLNAGKGRIKVKASGGIRDSETAQRLIEMGCQRLGVGFTSTPVLCSNNPNIRSDENY